MAGPVGLRSRSVQAARVGVRASAARSFVGDAHIVRGTEKVSVLHQSNSTCCSLTRSRTANACSSRCRKADLCCPGFFAAIIDAVLSPDSTLGVLMSKKRLGQFHAMLQEAPDGWVQVVER